MRISEVARSAGVSVETVRYYQSVGLLPHLRRPHSGFHVCTESDLARLNFIRRSKELGFSLNEIAELLKLSAQECAKAKKLAHRQLDLVHSRIKDLSRMATILEDFVRRCSRLKSHQSCPIIDSLSKSA
jgi:MerR family mercuric resistance operon transcriptional regulator